ncbi:hypothetical protein L3V79_04720 [Thiotrichales bacterium 19S9-12]|nr:hypothetical protein [Thiotrichales bacterium 19S9-11]MCF6811661.1 hypothetical protein [Thiotrichales bacterium 19S9-12]
MNRIIITTISITIIGLLVTLISIAVIYINSNQLISVQKVNELRSDIAQLNSSDKFKEIKSPMTKKEYEFYLQQLNNYKDEHTQASQDMKETLVNKIDQTFFMTDEKKQQLISEVNTPNLTTYSYKEIQQIANDSEISLLSKFLVLTILFGIFSFVVTMIIKFRP